MEIILFFLLFLFGILQIILFFKIWAMTNDVRQIKETITGEDEYMKHLRIYIKDVENIVSLTVGINRERILHATTFVCRWIEEYTYSIQTTFYDYEKQEKVEVNLLATCSGDPRLKSSWTFKQA